MLSRANNFLFIHYPKTGGNSIQNVLREYSSDVIVCTNPLQDGIERFEVRSNDIEVTKHSTLQDYFRQLDNEVFQRLIKVSTLRNPWDRMISFYFSPHRQVTKWNRDEFIRLVNDVKPFEFYVDLPTSQKVGEELDFIVKFEDLSGSFENLCELLNIPKVELTKRNSSLRNHYHSYYDDELIELVSKRFTKEIQLGQYTY